MLLKVSVNYLLMTVLCFSWFSVVFRDINTLVSDLNEDLEKIGNWAFKQKKNFNPDPNKQAQEIIFSRKKTASLHPVDFGKLKNTSLHRVDCTDRAFILYSFSL